MASKKLYSVCILLLIITLIFAHRVGNLSCDGGLRHDIQAKIGNQSFYLQKAESNADKEKGLGQKNCVNDNEGMLFVFGYPNQYPFWMKDMRFPIDILWLDLQGRVVDMKKSVEPATFPETFINAQPASYALELNAGQADKLGIWQGSRIIF